jgi:hypothetical protein
MKIIRWICCLLGSALAAGSIAAQTYPGSYPQTNISNGILQARIYLPDAKTGFYRGTRFDWAGVMGALEYKGHNYYGPFFEKFNPAVADVEIGNPIEAGINSAASGPVEEFLGAADNSAVGYSSAKPGEAFCKIGVGSLRKIDDAPYSSYTNYPILDGGTRTVKSGPDWIEFTQKVDCGSGYGYAYTKTIRLLKKEAVMTIEHRLINQGQKPIETQVYDHNFLPIDGQFTGPAIELRFPFSLKPTEPLGGLAEVRGNVLAFSKDLTGSDTFYSEFKGFGKTAADYEIRVVNHKTGAAVLIRGDQPLANIGVWAVRTVVAPEPFIDINIPAGRAFHWKYTYEFSTVPAGQ